jgi:hypothetical protein
VDWHRKQLDRSKVRLEVGLPAEFPDKYRGAIRKAVENCLVARLACGLDAASFERSVSILP